MQLGSSQYATEATVASGRTANGLSSSPFYWPTDGDAAVNGNLVVSGNEEVKGTLLVDQNTVLAADLTVAGDTVMAGTLGVGSAATFASTVSVTGNLAALSTATIGKPGPAGAGLELDVNGQGRFIAPNGVAVPGGVQVSRADMTVHIGASDYGVGDDHGSIQVTANNGANVYSLDINPYGGQVNIGGAPGATPAPVVINDNLTCYATVTVAPAEASADYVTIHQNDIAMNGNLDVYVEGQPAVAANTVHHLPSDGSDAWVNAAGGNFGIGTETPDQPLTVDGGAHITGAILTDSYIKGFQTTAYEGGFFGCGDAIIPNGQNSVVVTNALTAGLLPGGRILLNYKNPTYQGGTSWNIGPADGGGGALTAVPNNGSFVIYSQNAISTPPAPPGEGVTVSWMIISLG